MSSATPIRRSTRSLASASLLAVGGLWADAVPAQAAAGPAVTLPVAAADTFSFLFALPAEDAVSDIGDKQYFGYGGGGYFVGGGFFSGGYYIPTPPPPVYYAEPTYYAYPAAPYYGGSTVGVACGTSTPGLLALAGLAMGASAFAARRRR